MLRRVSFVFTILFVAHCTASANNVVLSNAVINGNAIEFSISWENAWNFWQQRGSHDAVWLFAKGKAAKGEWVHIDFTIESGKHIAMPPLTIEVPLDAKGVFVFNVAEGTYNIPETQVVLVADANLMAFTDIRIYAIEMVHIPQGAFFFGDGASISSLADTAGDPLLISSEDAINCALWSIQNANAVFPPTPLPHEIPGNYPKGFNPFYLMKYEISQVQYADFLNTLTYVQQQKRTAVQPSFPQGTFAMVNANQPDSLYRNGIAIKQPGIPGHTPAQYAMDGNANGIFDEEDDGLHRAANFLNWADVSAYLDWAALRPISEMEFEKACRGHLTPVAGEFAWGTDRVTNANHPVDDGTPFESVSDVPEEGSGLANHGNVVASEGWGLRGVLRTGFAASEGTERVESGAAFYGAMEMSGNVWEYTIMVAGEGVLFTGEPGDGSLDSVGNANETGWCNPDTGNGVLLKGGAWSSTIAEVGAWRDLAVSDRFYSHIKPTQRRNTTGGRGGR